MPKSKTAQQVAREQAITYLAHGLPVAQVAEKIGRNKNSIYRWMKLPKFAERLRFEVERDMHGAKRELGAIARRSIASASESLDQLERTRDNPNETSAARDRAAHRLLQHAFKWGEVLDPELSSNDASGRASSYLPRDFIRETASLTYKLERAVQIIGLLEQAMKNSNAPMPDNIAGLVSWMELQDYTAFVSNLKDSEILKRKPEDAEDSDESDESDEKSKDAHDPEKAEKNAEAKARDRRDAERRAKYRASELAGTEKPDDIDEEGEVKTEDDDTPPKTQNSGSAVTNVPTAPNVPPVPPVPKPTPVKYPRYLGE
jgi:hypothetical protein